MMQILESKDAVIDDLTKKLAATEQDQAEAACMQMEVGWLVQSAAEAKHELDALQREIVSGLQNDLRGNIEGSLRSVAEAKKEPDALQKEPAVQLEDLRRGVGWLVQSAAEAKQELDSLHKELVTGLQTETALCTKLAETLSEIIAGVQRELEGINHAAEQQTLTDQLAEATRTIDGLRNETQSLAEERDRLQNKLQDLEIQHAPCEGKIASLTKQLAALRTDLEDMVSAMQGVHGPYADVIEAFESEMMNPPAGEVLSSLQKELVTETALCIKLAETLSEIIAGVQRELEGINHAAESAQNQVDLVQDGACHPSFGRWFRAGPKTKEESRKATELERMLKVVTEEKKLIAEQLEKIQQEHTHCKAQINEIKATLSGLDASIAAELVDAVNDLRGDMEGLVQHLDELKEVSHCLHEGVCL